MTKTDITNKTNGRLLYIVSYNMSGTILGGIIQVKHSTTTYIRTTQKYYYLVHLILPEFAIVIIYYITRTGIYSVCEYYTY